MTASREKYETAAIKTHYSLGMAECRAGVDFYCRSYGLHADRRQRVVAGEFTIGDFVMINALLIQLYQPLHLMGTIYRAIRQSLVDLENLFGILNAKPEIVDKPGAKALVVDKGAVSFDHVSFAYDVERPIIKDIEF